MITVVNGGISRRIDPAKLHEYEQRGYKEVKADAKSKRRKKPVANAGVSADRK